MQDTRSRILDTAEMMARSGGYNSFSFREIATLIGVKSASVHYHFPTKEALTIEVARRYHKNFFNALGLPKPDGCDSATQIVHYCQVFKNAFEVSKRGCLCGVLTGEAAQLPQSVSEIINNFVEANIYWLEQALEGATGSEVSRKQARFIYSSLQGAMGISSLQQDQHWIDQVSEVICSVSFSQIHG